MKTQGQSSEVRYCRSPMCSEEISGSHLKKYCSARCRIYAHRRRQSESKPNARGLTPERDVTHGSRERKSKQIWDREITEPIDAYRAFGVYLGMGPARTMDATQTLLDCSLSDIVKWSGRWDWKHRSRAYDHDQVQEDLRAFDSAALSNSQKNRLLGREMQRVSYTQLKMLEGKTLTGSTIATLAKAGFEIERVAMGEPSQINESRVPPEFQKFIDWVINMPEKERADYGATLIGELERRSAQDASGDGAEGDGLPAETRSH